MQISILKERSFVFSICAFMLFGLIFSTSNIYATEPSWNLARGIASFIFGVVFLVSFTIFIFKVPSKNIKTFFRILLGFVWAPVLFFALIILSFLSTCSYRAPLKGTTFERPVNVRNTRIFIDYVGDQGALGFSAVGVYQDAPVLGSQIFFKTLLLCTSLEKYAGISFEVLNDQQIKCLHENGSTELIDLPL